jgi:Tol biopolymer transport system component
MALSAGTRLGPYEILSALGAGGMGEVYRARDATLNRDVALKVLPEAFMLDPDRLARFKREAQVLASLNHPHIAAIHGLEEANGVLALVLEMVEGETLADRITAGVPLDEALPIARQIAEALEAAHEQGIIHRDLKPANIKLRPDGTVKVLDFGLAKAMEPAPGSSSSLSMSPTITTPAMTQAGMILGTAAYMSPEQAKGRPADARSDVWALGCVLYEMFTGRRAFPGNDVAEVLASVIKSEPDWDALPSDVSPGLRAGLRRSLDKTPKNRLHAVADLRLAIEGAFDLPLGAAASVGVLAPPGRNWRRSWLWMLAAFVLGGSTAAAIVWWVTRREPPRVTRLAVTASPTQPLAVANTSHDLVISPDGANIVYWTGSAGAGALTVRPLNQLSRVVLQTRNAFGPFVSADSAWVGFYEVSDRTLKKVPILGGSPVTICSVAANVRGASWGADGTIVFAGPLGSLWRVAASGGEPAQITKADSTPGGRRHSWPVFLPGARAVLFTIVPAADGFENGETAQIALLNLDTGEQRMLIPHGSYPRYAPTGHLVYAVDGALRGAGFDLKRLEVTTSPVPLLEGVITKESGAANFSVADDGTLVYLPGRPAESQRTIVWVDRGGREEPLPGLPAGNHQSVRLSPDGTRLAIDPGQPRDIWTYDIARQTTTRITADAADDQGPLWTPDGQRIVFTSNRGGRPELYSQKSDGSGAAERLFPITDGTESIWAQTWTRDGTALLVAATGIGAVTMADRKFERLSQIRGGAPALSPDGRWLAYMSTMSGQWEIYVERFPQLGDRQKISTNGGVKPRWSRDGRTLYYISADGTRFFSVPVSTQTQLTAGLPQLLFEGTFLRDSAGTRPFDVTPDGQRFVMIKSGNAVDDTNAIIVVQHWFEELNRLVPVR